MSIYTFLILSHIIGTILGVGAATFAEIFYVRALKDGVVTPEEGTGLKVIYTILRIGLVLAVVSGFGFLVLYRLTGLEERLLDPKLWAKMTIIVVLVVNALLLQLHRMPMWLGASLSLTSWYAATILGAWRMVPYSYVQIMLGYLVAVAVVAVILARVKSWYLSDRKT